MASANGKSDLTDKQEKALKVFKDGGGAKEVAEALKISTTGAHSHINALRKKGYIDAEGKLTAKAVGARIEGVEVKTAPKSRPRTGTSRPADGSTSTVSLGAGRATTVDADGADAFALDDQVVALIKGHRESLVGTVGGIEKTIAHHQGRVAEIDAEVKALGDEKDRHLASIETLSNTKDEAEKALNALPAPA